MTQSRNSNSLEVREIDVIHPLTGEMLVVRDAETNDLARFLDEIREYESRLREAKSIVNREVLRRMDADAHWTTYTNDWQLSAPSPTPGEEFDGQKLQEALYELAEQGVISKDSVYRAVQAQVVYKVQAAGVKALRRLGGVVAETINRHATPTEKKRYVRVERS
jgi:hypothetical protein